MSEKFVSSEVLVKATAAVEESVKKDLEVADPTPEKAKAFWQDFYTGGEEKNENT